MMDQEKIGKFIAALRKEKELTQEQLAERLGVSNRSVSRWENGKNMPDLSLLPLLGEELGVSITELLNGEKQKGEDKAVENVRKIIAMSNEEKKRKAQKVNTYFLLGLFCIVVVILHGQFEILDFISDERSKNFLLGLLTGLGITFEIVGFYYNSKERKTTERELEVLANGNGQVRMKTAGEMLQYAKKSQKADLKQYEKAFQAIEEKLLPEETVKFSMVADRFLVSGQWADSCEPWHAGLAVTEQRLLICGEGIRGRFMTFYEVFDFKIAVIEEVFWKGNTLYLKGQEGTLKISGKDLAQAGGKLREIWRKSR